MNFPSKRLQLENIYILQNANCRNASKNEQESKANKTLNKQYMSSSIKLQHPVEKTTLAKQGHLAYFSNWSD